MWAQGDGWHMGGMWMWLWVPVVIVLVAVLVRRRGPSDRRGRPDGEGPQELLRRRFAAGEIDSATFVRMRDELVK